MGSMEVSATLGIMLRGLVAGTIEPESDAPEDSKPWLDDLLSRADTYRDAALIVLAYAVDAGSGADAATPPAAAGLSQGSSRRCAMNSISVLAAMRSRRWRRGQIHCSDVSVRPGIACCTGCKRSSRLNRSPKRCDTWPRTSRRQRGTFLRCQGLM